MIKMNLFYKKITQLLMTILAIFVGVTCQGEPDYDLCQILNVANNLWDQVSRIEFSSSGKFMATTSKCENEDIIKMWSFNQNTTEWEARQEFQGVSAKFLFGDTYFATTDSNGTTQLWTLNSNNEWIKGTQIANNGCDSTKSRDVYSPDGNFKVEVLNKDDKQCVTISNYCRATQQWISGRKLFTCSHFFYVDFSPDGKTLAIISLREGLKFFTLNDRKQWLESNPESCQMRACRSFGVFSSDGKTFVLINYNYNLATLFAFNQANNQWTKNQELRTTIYPGEKTSSASFSPNGETLAIGTNNTVRIYRRPPLKLVKASSSRVSNADCELQPE